MSILYITTYLDYCQPVFVPTVRLTMSSGLNSAQYSSNATPSSIPSNGRILGLTWKSPASRIVSSTNPSWISVLPNTYKHLSKTQQGSHSIYICVRVRYTIASFGIQWANSSTPLACISSVCPQIFPAFIPIFLSPYNEAP